MVPLARPQSHGYPYTRQSQAVWLPLLTDCAGCADYQGQVGQLGQGAEWTN